MTNSFVNIPEGIFLLLRETINKRIIEDSSIQYHVANIDFLVENECY